MKTVTRALGLDDTTCELAPFLADEWILDGDHDDDVVTGFGSARRHAIVAHVRTAKGPVTRAALEERFGRFQVPTELVRVAKGTFALAEQVADWDRWQRRLPRIVGALIERNGPERRWTTGELVPLLSEEGALPPWLDEWTLGSLLRRASGIRYLGRNEVVLEAYAPDRGALRDGVVDVLRRAGGPLRVEDAFASLRDGGPFLHRGAPDHLLDVLRLRRPFLLFEGDRIGLYPRDVPGGEPTAERACALVFDALGARQAGLQAFELRELLSTLGEPWSRWDLRMVRSLLRHDGRFRCAPGGAVGLGEWEDVRAPSQREVLEELMIEHDGVVPIGFALTAVPTASGAALAMDQLARLSQSLGADFDGDHIRWQNDGASETADDDASPSMNEALRDVCSTALTLLAAGADASVEMSLDGLGEAEAMLDAVVRAVS